MRKATKKQAQKRHKKGIEEKKYILMRHHCSGNNIDEDLGDPVPQLCYETANGPSGNNTLFFAFYVSPFQKNRVE